MRKIPTHAHRMALLLALWGVGISASISGCGGGPSEEDVQRAEVEFRLASGLLEEQNMAGAFQHLQEAIRLDPDFTEAHFLMGTLFLARGDYTEAESSLRDALRANAAQGAAGTPAITPDVHNSLGVVYLHMRRLDDAERELRLSTGDLMNRTPHLAWGNLGWAYYEMGQYDQAMEALEQAVRHQPLFCVGWYRIGQVHYALGSAGDESAFGRAEDALTRALEVDDEACRRLQDAWQLRGETRARLGRREDAVDDLETCVQLSAETETGQTCVRLLDEDTE